MGAEPALVADPKDVTAAWLTEVLRHAGTISHETAVAAVEPTPIGTGQAGANVRYALTYAGAPGPVSIEPAARRHGEEALVARYHRALVGHGVTTYSAEQCWDDYRRSSFNGLRMAVLASLGVERTERGDAMFAAMAHRSAQMAIDLDAQRLLQRSS